MAEDHFWAPWNGEHAGMLPPKDSHTAKPTEDQTIIMRIASARLRPRSAHEQGGTACFAAVLPACAVYACSVSTPAQHVLRQTRNENSRGCALAPAAAEISLPLTALWAACCGPLCALMPLAARHRVCSRLCVCSDWQRSEAAAPAAAEGFCESAEVICVRATMALRRMQRCRPAGFAASHCTKCRVSSASTPHTFATLFAAMQHA